jgi:hypothetical protein
MKKLAFFLLTILIMAGCGGKKENKPVENKANVAFDSSDIKTKPVDNPNQGFFLRYKFAKDKKYSFRLTTISNSSQNLKADTIINQQLKQQVIYLLDVTAKDIDKDSTTELSINVSYVDIYAEANGKKFKYQTGQKADSTEKARYAEFESLVNNPFSITVSKVGEITDVFRVDKIVNRLLEISGAKDKVSTEEKNMLKQRIVESGLRPILAQLFRKLPMNSIAKDTLWQNIQPAGRYLSYAIQSSNSFKVKSLEQLNDDKIAVIDAGLSAKAEGQSKVNEKGIQYDIKKPVISGDGVIYFNVSKGMVQKSKTKSRTEMNITMEGPSPKGGKQKMVKKEVMENTNLLELL